MILVAETKRKLAFAVRAEENNLEELQSIHTDTVKVTPLNENGLRDPEQPDHYYVMISDRLIVTGYHYLSYGDWLVVSEDGVEILTDDALNKKYKETTSELWPQRHLKTL